MRGVKRSPGSVSAARATVATGASPMNTAASALSTLRSPSVISRKGSAFPSSPVTA